MHKLRIVAGLAFVAAVGLGLSAGRTPAQPGGDKDAHHRKVTVTGYASVTVKPDTARMSFAVKGTGSDFRSAAAECDKNGAVVEKALKELKIGGLEVKKGPLSASRVFGEFPGLPGGPGGFPDGPVGGPGDPPGRGPDGLRGKSVAVSRTYALTATFGRDGGAGQPDDLVPVADKLLAAVAGTGVTEPHRRPVGGLYDFLEPAPSVSTGPEFTRSNLSALRQEALKAAVADALASARAATGVADLTLKNVVTITDQSAVTDAGRREVPGEAELTARVVVTFSY